MTSNPSLFLVDDEFNDSLSLQRAFGDLMSSNFDQTTRVLEEESSSTNKFDSDLENKHPSHNHGVKGDSSE